MLRKTFIMSIGLIVALGVVGCGGSRPAPANNKVVYKSVTKVYVSSKIPLDQYIAGNIQSECSLDSRLLESLKSAAESNGIELIVDGKPSAADAVLKLKITNAISRGNAFVGHRKYVVVSGELFEGSRKITDFQVARRSGGGMFGGYKSSCAVLGGCTTSIAKDIVKWLEKPTDHALLGNRELIRPRNRPYYYRY